MESEIAIHHLGKPKRKPLEPVSPQNTSLSRAAYVPPQPSQVFVKRNYCSIPVPAGKRPPRIISQHIGVPFEIRIPTTQIKMLEEQVKELRKKYAELETQSMSGTMKSKFQEISKSTKQIEEQIEAVLNDNKSGFDNTATSDGFSQEAEKGLEELMSTIEDSYTKIVELEQQNNQLESQLTKTTEDFKKMAEENELLKKQLTALTLT